MLKPIPLFYLQTTHGAISLLALWRPRDPLNLPVPRREENIIFIANIFILFTGSPFARDECDRGEEDEEEDDEEEDEEEDVKRDSGTGKGSSPENVQIVR